MRGTSPRGAQGWSGVGCEGQSGWFGPGQFGKRSKLHEEPAIFDLADAQPHTAIKDFGEDRLVMPVPSAVADATAAGRADRASGIVAGWVARFRGEIGFIRQTRISHRRVRGARKSRRNGGLREPGGQHNAVLNLVRFRAQRTKSPPVRSTHPTHW